MATVEHVSSGEGAPDFVPPSLGAHYTDTVTGQQWSAYGTESPADWRMLPGTLAAVFSSPVTHQVPAGVSHVRIMAEGSPSTLTVSIPHRTHTEFDPEGLPFRTSLDVEIVQAGSNHIGDQVIASPEATAARVVNGVDLGASIVGATVSIPSRTNPWQALLRVVVADGVLTVYVLAVEEFQ